MSGLINRVRELHDFGQKAWLEVSGGKLLAPGKLGRLIDYDGITGICSDPASLPQTLADNEHDDAIVRGLAAPGAPAEQISESVNLQDTRRSADRLLRTFRNADGYDGFVSLEVSPIFAFDAAGMVAEARRLLGALDRANILIQVPATREGLSAIRQLTSEGVCVSATMVFGVTRYREVVDAFIRGLEDRRSKGHLLNRIVSVAGVSVNRIDTMVDEKLRSLPKRFSAQAGNALLGKAGVQVARFAYQVYKQTVASPRWASLAAQGARPQRLLWTGTDATNLADGDVRYV
ncbi:MAG TPA: transaldolase family protein, partial [Burkholderiaceae bacterium]|nr:transaldolase family protein [Burkholderiaceae bacterium]